jgi:hypothetical protein
MKRFRVGLLAPLSAARSVALFACVVLVLESEGATREASAAVQACTGDCGANGVVSVDEIVTLVNIALGAAAPSSCSEGVASGASVDITVLVQAVGNTLNGCAAPGASCRTAAGSASTTCVRQYAAAIRTCRDAADAACETALRSDDGTLAALLAATEAPIRATCTADAAAAVTFGLGIDDLVARTAQTCRKYAEDAVAISYASDVGGLTSDALACQRVVGMELAALHDTAEQAYGEGCFLAELNGQPCNRVHAFARVANARTQAATAIEERCGALFDDLGLVGPGAGATREERIAVLVALFSDRVRELAERVYPPFNLGPTALLGLSPVGVHALDLVDAGRTSAAGTGARPIHVEVYYPSTPDAVAGAPRDVAQFLGIPLFDTPTYRDVARAPGRLPLVLFSPGSGSDPFTYTFFAAHLASHGFLVAGIQHDGDNLLDHSDANSAVNRPLDLRVVIDRFLAFENEAGNFFEGAVDGTRIGAAGHSAGGYTAMALAMCPYGLGTFTDPRVTAILPLDPSAQSFLTVESPAIFSAIATPILLLGGTSSQFADVQPLVYAALEPGPLVTDFANLRGALHGTFTDNCEIPDAFAIATGGLFPECEPGALPWRYARYLTNYLALNFFDATLNGSASARARLDLSSFLFRVEDLLYESKARTCADGSSCALSCGETVCSDGIVNTQEVCDPPGEEGTCAAGALCNSNCTACVTCGDATVIPSEGGVTDGTTVDGTSNLGSSCGGDSLAPERVFAWTPSGSHVATIQTCGGTTDFDTTLYVREDTCVGADLACNDDGAADECGPRSMVTLPVTGGTTYYIVVDGSGTKAGRFTLSVE